MRHRTVSIPRRSHQRSDSHRCVDGSLCSELLGGLLLLPSVRSVLSRVTEFNGYSMTGRLHFWQGALAMWSDHPLFGVGLGNFAFYYPQYQADPYNYSIDPHSWPLQLLCELGVPGMLIFVAILIGTMMWLKRIWRSLPRLEAGC